MEKKCLLNGEPWVEFAVSCKLKHEVEPDKLTAVGDIDIQQINMKHFFWMAWKKNHESYL